MKPTKEDVLAAFRRTELLSAGRRVFGRLGFEHATMEAIAEAAGVAKGTVYLYYLSKQAIYDATFAQGLAELEQLTRIRVESAAGPKDAIAGFVDARVTYFKEHPDYFHIYVEGISRQLTGRAPGKGVGKTALDGQTRALQTVFEEAIATGHLRSIDPAAAALAVFDITRGFIGRRLLTGALCDVERDIAFLTDLIWTGLRRDPVKQGRTT